MALLTRPLRSVITNTLPSAPQPPQARWTRFVHHCLTPLHAMIEIARSASSPGLNDGQPVSTLDIRNGGQHRY